MDTPAKQNLKTEALVLPTMLSMEKTIELTPACPETFFYRRMDKRVIDYEVINDQRWSKIRGPLVRGYRWLWGYSLHRQMGAGNVALLPLGTA